MRGGDVGVSSQEIPLLAMCSRLRVKEILNLSQYSDTPLSRSPPLPPNGSPTSSSPFEIYSENYGIKLNRLFVYFQNYSERYQDFEKVCKIDARIRMRP